MRDTRENGYLAFSSFSAVLSGEEALEDRILGLFLGESQGLELQELIARDLADGSLVDELRVSRIGADGGDGFDRCLAHDDRIALHVAEALAVAHDHGAKDLLGLVLRNRAGNDAATGVLAVEFDLHVALGKLLAMRQQPFGDDGLGALAADDLRLAHGGVDAADLNGLHLDACTLVEVDDRGGVHHTRTAAVALAVMLFRIAHVGILGDIKGVDTVVTALVTAGVVDAAACDDVHIAVFADVKVIVDHFSHAAFADDDGNVALLALCAVLDANDDAAFALGLWVDGDVLGGLARFAAAVLSDVERADGFARQVGDLFKQGSVDFSDHVFFLLTCSAPGRSPAYPP